MAVDLDPLTYPCSTDLQPWGWGCDCGAEEWMCHSQICSVTPIYASMVEHADPPPLEFWRDIAPAAQSVINCAICGKQRVAKDLLVIYKAPIAGTLRHQIGVTDKRPENMLKAVCTEHNRVGKASFQRGSLISGY